MRKWLDRKKVSVGLLVGLSTGAAWGEDVTLERALLGSQALSANLLPEHFPFVPTEPVATADELIFSAAISTPAQKKLGCRGHDLFSAPSKEIKEGEVVRHRQIASIYCVVRVANFQNRVLVQTRDEKTSQDSLLILGPPAETRELTKAFPEILGEGGALYTRQALGVDLLRRSKETGLRRRFPASLFFAIDGANIFFLSVPNQRDELTYLIDGFSIDPQTGQMTAPLFERVLFWNTTKVERRKIGDFQVQGEKVFISWDGNRDQAGAVTVLTMNQGKGTPLEEDVLLEEHFPTDIAVGAEVDGTEFAARNPLSIVPMQEGFLGIEAGVTFSEDIPFVFYYEYRSGKVRVVPQLSDRNRFITAIRPTEGGILVSEGNMGNAASRSAGNFIRFYGLKSERWSLLK